MPEIRGSGDQRCGNCDRSIAGRFSEDAFEDFCLSCEADWEREVNAGHVTDPWGCTIYFAEID